MSKHFIIMIVIVLIIVFAVFVAAIVLQSKMNKQQKVFLQSLSAPEPADYSEKYSVVGMYYQGIDYDVNCYAYLVREHNEHDKNAIGVYTKDGDIKLGYIAKDEKDRKLYNMLKKNDNYLLGIVEISVGKYGTDGDFYYML